LGGSCDTLAWRGWRDQICEHDADSLLEMVRAGMALAFTRYSNDYVADEEKAKAARLGLHALACVPAWERRAQQR
jgi:endonuclease YncB( thermonuclease family)